MRLRCTWIILLALAVVLCPVQASTQDPYAILKVNRKASQGDIRQSYKALCLKYHPDKNVGRSPREQKQCEETFKTIQKAYSMIGNPESRRNHDLMARYGMPYGLSSPRRRQGGSPFSNNFQRVRFSSVEELFSEFFRQRYTFDPPTGSPFGTTQTPTDFFNLARFKSVYVQNVAVPLEDLFSGKIGYELSLKQNIWQRLRAAFRGGVGLVLLYQSFLFALPMLRFSKIASLIVGISLFQGNLPEPSKCNFFVNLKPGYKEGTKITFTEPGYDAVFVLKEAHHKLFVRKGNDLYTTIDLTQQQARRGIVLEISHLDGSPLEIRVPPGSKTGSLIRMEQLGWPNRRTNLRGDLLVQLRVKSRAR